jgi:hypothetical protein
MFTLRGRLRGDTRICEITWQDGKLYGSPGLVELLIREAARLDGKPVGPEPTGPYTWSDHLGDPLSTLVLLGRLVEPDATTYGDVPGVVSQNEGAIA